MNITCSVGLPALISESGVQSGLSGGYESINGVSRPDGVPNGRGGGWTLMSLIRDVRSRRIVPALINWVGGVVGSMKDGSAWRLPIKDFTLIKLWYISQFTFAVAMGMTW